MLRLRRKSSGKVSARVAVLSGAAVAAVALSAVGAGPASAAVKCTGSNITGAGSSLQKIAQENWKTGFNGAGVCPGGPTISYNSIGSGAGLKEWNSAGGGSINTATSFIGSDDAPSPAQLANIESTAAGAKIAVIPVAQTAIALIANPPAECEVGQITNSNLAGVMEGRILTWNKIEGAESLDAGEVACNAPITRVVRADGSGTTFQFKNYLFQIFKKGLPCTTGETEGKASWEELEPQTTPNLTWPETCAEKTLSTVKHALKGGTGGASGTEPGTGGGDVVKTVDATSGSIGYAALPDAKNAANAPHGHVQVLFLQNNGQKTGGAASFANPASGTTANCGAITYTGFKLSTGLDVDWSSVFGAKPSIGGKNYPLCTLTYDLAWHGYKAAGFTEGQEITAADLLNGYITQPAGQAVVNGNFYGPLPTSSEARFNVLAAAQKAAGSISY